MPANVNIEEKHTSPKAKDNSQSFKEVTFCGTRASLVRAMHGAPRTDPTPVHPIFLGCRLPTHKTPWRLPPARLSRPSPSCRVLPPCPIVGRAVGHCCRGPRRVGPCVRPARIATDRCAPPPAAPRHQHPPSRPPLCQGVIPRQSGGGPPRAFGGQAPGGFSPPKQPAPEENGMDRRWIPTPRTVHRPNQGGPSAECQPSLPPLGPEGHGGGVAPPKICQANNPEPPAFMRPHGIYHPPSRLQGVSGCIRGPAPSPHGATLHRPRARGAPCGGAEGGAPHWRAAGGRYPCAMRPCAAHRGRRCACAPLRPRAPRFFCRFRVRSVLKLWPPPSGVGIGV